MGKIPAPSARVVTSTRPTTTDIDGRKIGVKPLPMGAFSRLLRIAGAEHCQNQVWLAFAMITLSVTGIEVPDEDGNSIMKPILDPKSLEDIDNILDQLGSDGVAAVRQWENEQAMAKIENRKTLSPLS